MNKKQKAVVFLALFAFVLTLVAAPWNITETFHRSNAQHILRRHNDPVRSWTETKVRTEYAPVWSPPTSGNPWLNESACQLRTESLVIEWLGIGVIGGVLFRMFRG